MSPIIRTKGTGPVLDAAHLDERLERMRHALRSCPAEVPAGLSIPAHERLDEVAERLALGVDHTVVALFGGTGSGKSSLFNALTQLQFADVGARRPTTSRAAACSWGDDARALLDFLGVSEDRRIRRESLLDASEQDDLAGLVLLDVPDYDSVTTEHALQVDRLVPLADVLVWVVDPQKYADAALHEGYLRGLGARQEDMLVLVNQVDTLPSGGADRLLADVRALLDADGLQDVRVLPVSAVRGDNLRAVRDILCERVARESNAARTASARMDDIARTLRGTAATRTVSTNPDVAAAATTSLVRVSGAQAVEDSVRDGLSRALPRALTRPEPPSRSSVAAVRSTWLRRTTDGLPEVWLRSVEQAVAVPEALAAQTAEAVGSVPLPSNRAPVIELAWWGGLLAVLASLAWAALALTGGGGLVGPIVLLVLGLVLAVWAASARRARAKREAQHYADQIRARLSSIVTRGLTEPADEVLARHAMLRTALTQH
ncbi:GTPase [Actinomyces howellii]|uniref:GTPase Era n=1 Tax=Actinomyces howellii TaxID=52771 RepID=A0A3S4TBK6_9ACTO|nr:GTPase [Actinomyces howellii]VEG30149.1 GTPase Era [Actinomyces howellii]